MNDHAEHAVPLIQEQSTLITNDEMLPQFLLQVVQDHRRMYLAAAK